MLGDRPMLGLAHGTMAIFNPRKSVIVDMVMVQLLAIITTLGIIMLTGSDSLASDTIAYLVAGIFGALFMLGGIYARLTNL
tara:strand:+ start:2198 stop:2440 length:243 start_codon:yes stop_codon:yes gene_type:complete